MKIKYFEDTDTLYIEFRAVEVAETKDLDENTLLDLDPDGQHLWDYRGACPRAHRTPEVLVRTDYGLTTCWSGRANSRAPLGMGRGST